MMPLTSFPPVSSPTAIISQNSVRVIKQSYLKSARVMDFFSWSVDFLDFFLAAWSKVFRKASLSRMKEEVSSRLAKSAVV